MTDLQDYLLSFMLILNVLMKKNTKIPTSQPNSKKSYTMQYQNINHLDFAIIVKGKLKIMNQ